MRYGFRSFVAGTAVIAAVGILPHAANAASVTDTMFSDSIAAESAKGFPFAPTRAIQRETTKDVRKVFRAGTAHCNPDIAGGHIWYCIAKYRKSGDKIAIRVHFFEDGSVKTFTAINVPRSETHKV